MANKIHVQEKDTDKREELKTNFADLINVLTPVLIVEKCCGVYRFRILNNKLAPPSIKMKLMSCLASVLFTSLFSVFFEKSNDDTGTEKILDLIEDVPQIMVVAEYIVITNVTSFFLGNSNIDIISKIAQIDKTLFLDGDKMFYRQSKRKIFKFLLFLVVIYTTNAVCNYTYWNDSDSVVQRFLVVIVYFIQDLETLVFYNFISMLNDRLRVVNKNLLRANKEGESKGSISTIFTLTKKQDKECINIATLKKIDLRELASTYDRIGETCCNINRVFNVSILMSLVTTFSFIVITIWTSLYYFRTSQDIAHSLFLIIAWCISDVVSIVVMCFTCCNLLKTRDETKVLVNELIMNYSLPKSTRAQAKAFIGLIGAWPLRIFVFDMFSVDITLLMKFISVSTTYLIIMIQVSHFL